MSSIPYRGPRVDSYASPNLSFGATAAVCGLIRGCSEGSFRGSLCSSLATRSFLEHGLLATGCKRRGHISYANNLTVCPLSTPHFTTVHRQPLSDTADDRNLSDNKHVLQKYQNIKNISIIRISL